MNLRKDHYRWSLRRRTPSATVAARNQLGPPRAAAGQGLPPASGRPEQLPFGLQGPRRAPVRTTPAASSRLSLSRGIRRARAGADGRPLTAAAAGSSARRSLNLSGPVTHLPRSWGRLRAPGDGRGRSPWGTGPGASPRRSQPSAQPPGASGSGSKHENFNTPERTGGASPGRPRRSSRGYSTRPSPPGSGGEFNVSYPVRCAPQKAPNERWSARGRLTL